VKRLFGIGRSRAGRFGLVAGVVVAALGGLSAPAYAHHAIVSGSTVCAGNDHVITWSIGNNRDDEAMTIESATATVNGDTYAVTGYTSPVGFSGTTTATTVVPGSVDGTVTLSVHVTWPTYENVNTADVPLQGGCGHDNNCDDVHPGEGNDQAGHNNPDCATTTTTEPVTTTTAHHCGCSTTTTTVPETTTTVPETTTTVPETTTTVAETTTTEHHCGCSTTTTEATTTTSEPVTTSTQALGTTTIVTTTTLGHQGSTVPTTQPPASTTQPPTSTTQAPPPAGQLPFTGSSTTFPLIFGLGSLILGGVFAFRKRNAWTQQ